MSFVVTQRLTIAKTQCETQLLVCLNDMSFIRLLKQRRVAPVNISHVDVWNAGGRSSPSTSTLGMLTSDVNILWHLNNLTTTKLDEICTVRLPAA